MATALILGGGFGGVVAGERLAKELGDEHQITLVSRSRRFVFYPAFYVHKDIWTDESASVGKGRFWSWAKHVQEKYWETMHF